MLEDQQLAAHGLVDTAGVHAGEAAQVPLLEPPDVAVRAAGGVAQAARGALGDVGRLLRGGEVGAELDELLAKPDGLPGLVEERGAVEHAGDELADAGERREVRAPVALGVVVEVHQPDELPAGDQRHRQRAGEPPAAHELGFGPAEPGVAQVADREWRVVQQRPLERGIAGRVQDRVAGAGILALPRVADDRADDPTARAPDVDAVGVGGGEQPLREAQDEALEVMRLRHLVGEVDQLAHGLVAVRQLVHRPLDRDGLGADARQALERVGVAREVPLAGVAELQGADELAAQHHRRPGERAAAAPLHGQSRAAREAAVRGAHAEDLGSRGIALDRRPLPGRPRRALAARVELAGLRGDGEPYRLAVPEVHVAARRAGELAERARRLGRHVVRVVGEQRHEVQADLQHRAQDLALAPAAPRSHRDGRPRRPRPPAAARGRRRRDSGDGPRGCGARRCARRRSSAAPCSRSRPARTRRRRRAARRARAPL